MQEEEQCPLAVVVGDAAEFNYQKLSFAHS